MLISMSAYENVEDEDDDDDNDNDEQRPRSTHP
jgi:hypothetical protein